jgi:hypothetical protein
MAGKKLTPAQAARVEMISEFLRTVERVKHSVAELESNRAARSQILDNICGGIARDLTHMRQRALTANIGTVADVAGALAVMAGRGGGLNMKIRGLNDGVNNLAIQLDHALKQAMEGDEEEPTPAA